MARVAVVTEKSRNQEALFSALAKAGCRVCHGTLQVVRAACKTEPAEVVVLDLAFVGTEDWREFVCELHLQAVRPEVLLLASEGSSAAADAQRLCCTVMAANLSDDRLLLCIEQARRAVTARHDLWQSASLQEGLLAQFSTISALAFAAQQAARDVAGNTNHALRRVAEHLGMASRDLLDPIDANLARINVLMTNAHRFVQPLAQHREPLVFGELIEAAIASLRTAGVLATDSGVAVRCPSNLPSFSGNRSELTAVIAELARNALAATKGKGLVEVGAWFTAKEFGIDVKDDGPGVANKRRAAIWLPFQHALHGGVGIGLATCRKIIAAHHGELVLMPAQRSGARFRIRFSKRSVSDSA
jgi:signal transduction histidine kinase